MLHNGSNNVCSDVINGSYCHILSCLPFCSSNVLSFLSVTEEKRKNKLFQATQTVLLQCILQRKKSNGVESESEASDSHQGGIMYQYYLKWKFVFICLSFVCILSIILEQSNTVLLSKVKPLCKYCTALDKNPPVLLYMDYPCI